MLPLSSACAESAEAEPLDSVWPFLQKHWYSCHGPKKQETERRVDTLKTDLSNVDTLKRWQGVLDALNRGEMPPEDSPQPEAKELAKVIDVLSARLKEAYAKHRSTGGQTVARRLNRFELRNTVRDLLYLNDPELRIGNVARLSLIHI